MAQEARARKEEEEKKVRERWKLVERKRERRRGVDEYVIFCLDYWSQSTLHPKRVD